MLKLRNTAFAHDTRPIDEKCDCVTCRTYTRAYLHTVVCRALPFACSLVSLHNLTYMARLGQEIREAITEQRFPEYARDMVACAYPDGDVPEWITLGLELADITL
jgi:queuine tRNA-ribosyltransferase